MPVTRTNRRTAPTEDVPHSLGLLAPAHDHAFDRLAHDVVRGQHCGRIADVDAAGRRKRLQPRGHINDVAHRRVAVGTDDRADEHFAGVDTDTQAQCTVEVRMGP